MPSPNRIDRGGAESTSPAEAIEVSVVDRQRSLHIPRGWLAELVQRAVGRLGLERATLCVLLVDDRRMARLHRRWLGISGPTDVITFDLSGGEAGSITGDIAVSTETARRVAREVGWHPRHEAAYYAIHGLLHLAGCDDHSPADRRVMRRRERTLLAAVGLPAPPPRRRRVAR